MKYTLRLPAANDMPGVIYAPGAFDGMVGRDLPIITTDQQGVTGKVVSAEVVDDGTAVLLGIEMDDDAERYLGGELGSFSVGWFPTDGLVLRPNATE